MFILPQLWYTSWTLYHNSWFKLMQENYNKIMGIEKSKRRAKCMAITVGKLNKQTANKGEVEKNEDNEEEDTSDNEEDTERKKKEKVEQRKKKRKKIQFQSQKKNHKIFLHI